MSQRHYATAQALYQQGRFYQAAETAAAARKLSEAIRHLYWARGQQNS